MRCKYTETLTSIKRSPRGFFTSQKNAHVLRLLTTPSGGFRHDETTAEIVKIG